MTQKKSDRPRSTHQLETARGGTSQDTERIRPTEAHSHTGDRTGRDKSGHRKNPTDRDPLTDWRPHREGQVRSQKESNRQGPLTDWRPHREGQVRTQKESNRPMLTHSLETAQGGTSHENEKKGESSRNWIKKERLTQY